MDTLTLVTAVAGVLFGLIGTVLGCINTWHHIRRDSHRLVVELALGFVESDPRPRLIIKAKNPSKATITIDEIGFLLRDRRRLVFAGPFPGRVELPKTLAEGAAATFILPLGTDQHRDWRNAKRAYVRTATDQYFTTGAKPVGRSLVRIG